MNRWLIPILAGFLATSAITAVAEEPKMLGLYFNREAIFDDCIMVAPNTPFTIYLILTHPTEEDAAAVNAYELGLEFVVPKGKEDTVFRLASRIGDNAVKGLDVGANGPLGGDYIVGLASPIPASEAMILHSWDYMMTETYRADIFIGASSKPSIPGAFPVVQKAEGSVLRQEAVAPSWDNSGAAAIINECRGLP